VPDGTSPSLPVCRPVTSKDANRPRAPRHTGRITVRVGRHAGLDMRVRLTSRGILAVGGLVSSILLSTAVLVAVSVRESRN